jgi:site-specific DNA-methyltransferase (adenine-specific)
MIERSESGKNLINQYVKRGTTFKLSKSDVSSKTSTEVNPEKYDPNLKNPSTIIKFNVDRSRKHKHPTKKPVSLCEYLIRTYTNEGDLVLDNCAGSGTTLLAAKNTGRHFRGIEKDEKYFNVAKDRLLSQTMSD